MRRVRFTHWLPALAILVFSIAAFKHTTSLACSIVNNSGENFYVSDPLFGCLSTPVVNGFPSTKMKVRRDTITHIILVRNGVDFMTAETSRGSISNQHTGNINGIGFLEFDLKLAKTDATGDIALDFFPKPNLPPGGALLFTIFRVPVTVIRRGQITSVTQTPSPSQWGTVIDVKVAGRDIGNADVFAPYHAIVGTPQSTNDSLRVSLQASGSAQTQVDLLIWDKTFGRTAGAYRKVGSPTAGTLAYSANAGVAACTSVPGISAPQPSSPANGAVMSFNSATEPVKATVAFGWTKVGDPGNEYILQIEMYSAPTATITTTTTMTKSGSTTTLAPLMTFVDTVTASGTGQTGSVTKYLTRNRMYKWKVRARNCLQSAPYSTVSSFTVR